MKSNKSKSKKSLKESNRSEAEENMSMKGSEKDVEESKGDELNHQEEEIEEPVPEPEIPVEDVRDHILKHYGISAEEENAKKERKAEKFRNYVQNSGLQMAFQLVISELLAKDIPQAEVFKYSIKRFKEIGKEYSEIKKTLQPKK